MQQRIVIAKENEEVMHKNLSYILEKSERELQEGKIHDAKEVFSKLREKYSY